jgi:hypothetical protein
MLPGPDKPSFELTAAALGAIVWQLAGLLIWGHTLMHKVPSEAMILLIGASFCVVVVSNQGFLAKGDKLRVRAFPNAEISAVRVMKH